VGPFLWDYSPSTSRNFFSPCSGLVAYGRDSTFLRFRFPRIRSYQPGWSCDLHCISGGDAKIELVLICTLRVRLIR
jgi:hypothetical protein